LIIRSFFIKNYIRTWRTEDVETYMTVSMACLYVHILDLATHRIRNIIANTRPRCSAVKIARYKNSCCVIFSIFLFLLSVIVNVNFTYSELLFLLIHITK
jgi:hypothetical protein